MFSGQTSSSSFPVSSTQLCVWFLNFFTLRRKCRDGIEFGTVTSPNARLLFLGDSGAGKTSTCRHLCGKTHPDQHDPTEGVDSIMTEWTEVNADWQDVTEETEGSALDHALAYFCAFRETKLRSETSESLLLPAVLFILMVVFVLVFALWSLNVTFGVQFKASSFVIFCSSEMLFILFFVDVILGLGIIFHEYLCTAVTFLVFAAFNVVLVFRIKASEVDWIFFLNDADNQRQCCEKLVKGMAIGLSFWLLSYQKPRALSFIFLLTSILYQSSIACSITPYIVMYLLSALNFCYSFEHKRTTSSLKILTIEHFPYLIAFSIATFSLIIVFLIIDNFFPEEVIILNHLPEYVVVALGVLIGTLLCRSVLKILNIGQCHNDRFGWEIVVDVLVSYGVAIYATFQLNLSARSRITFLNPFVVIVFSLAEYLHWRLRHMKELPLKDLLRLLGHTTPWPVKLSILDCGGQRIYNAAHHIYMTRNSTYVIVFRLTDLCIDFEATLSRIRFWLASVTAHAQHPRSSIILVATHAENVSLDDRTAALRLLEREVMQSHCNRLVTDLSSSSRIIALDNKQRSQCSSELQRLRYMIWETASKAEFVSQPSRVAWFRFGDIVHDARKAAREGDCSTLVVSGCTLWEAVKEPCHLTGKADFGRMLRFFHDRGDIFCDCQGYSDKEFILLDPSVLERAFRRILPLQADNRSFLVSREHLLNSLNDLCGDSASLLKMLENLGLVLPRQGLLSSEFILPHNLPQRSPDVHPLIDHPSFIARFDFETFVPQPVFLRLLSTLIGGSCDCLSIFSNAAVLRSPDAITYSLELSQDNKMWMIIDQNTGEDGALEKLYFLQGLLRRVCLRYFEFLTFCVEVPCCCSREAVLSDPHGAHHAEFTTIMKFSPLPLSPLLSVFPDRQLRYVCARERRIYNFDARRLSSQKRRIEEQMRSWPGIELPLAHCSDIFVSCAQPDSYFVLEELLPVLEAPWNLFESVDSVPELSQLFERPLSMMTDFCDNAEQDRKNRRLLTIANADMLLAIISRSSLEDRDCRKERDYALALGLTVVPLILNACEMPAELMCVRGIHFDCTAGTAQVRSFVSLLRAIKRALTKRQRSTT